MNKKILYTVLVVLIVVLVAGWFAWKWFLAPPAFHAVSLMSGEVYFGKLVTFPSFGLKQVYNIQVNPENEENPLSIQKFSDVFWGPSDFMKINRDNIVWSTELSKDGQLYQLLKNNPNLQAQPNLQGQQLPGGVSTQPGVNEPPVE